MKTKTAILLFAALAAAVCAHARTVNATWTNTSATAANIRIDSRTVGDATVPNPVWSPWTSTTAKVEAGATYEYQSEGWSLVSKPSAQPPYYQLVEVKVYEATLTVESYEPPAETWTPFDEPGEWTYGTWSPDPSTVDNGTAFTQTRSATRYHRTGERSNVGNERGVGGYTETASESRPALGTRNRPPTVAWADVPQQITYGVRYAVKAAGHDPDGNLARVDLQHRVNGGAWLSAEDYKPGIAQPAATPGATIEYRAIAFDSAGADSGWITWGPVTVSAR